MTGEPEVIIRVEGGVGRLTLNRPDALHALTLSMCHAMTKALLAWQDDPAIRLVMLDHSSGRGFCAGGDVRFLYDSLKAGDGQAIRFFHDEYQLDHLLFAYRKPTIVFMDGLVMGGGSGVAMPCRYRLATERTVFAMPETGIGLFPDVGASRFLPRLPGCAGMWMALTGARAKAADCLLFGLATDFVHAEDLERLKTAILADPDGVETLLTEVEADEGRPDFAAIEDAVERTFCGDRVENILIRLEEEGDWGAKQIATIRSKSPLLSKIAFHELREGAHKIAFADNMAMEFRMVSRVIMTDDFSEGVRAVIVDKDNAPRWSPTTLEAVTPEMVEAVFAPLSQDQEWKPLPQAKETGLHA
jgi:enoyl-CoA hydratase